MPTNVNHVSTAPITNQILAIRDRWHTKRHPFFRAFGEGQLALTALGRYKRCTTTSSPTLYEVLAYSIRASTSSRTCAR